MAGYKSMWMKDPSGHAPKLGADIDAGNQKKYAPPKKRKQRVAKKTKDKVHPKYAGDKSTGSVFTGDKDYNPVKDLYTKPRDFNQDGKIDWKDTSMKNGWG